MCFDIARCPKNPEHDFPTKRRDFLKLIGPVTALWILYPTEFMHMVSTEPLLARTVFARSNKVLCYSLVPQKPGSTIFRQNVVIF